MADDQIIIFQKPLDVTEPTVIDSSKCAETIRLMLRGSKVGGHTHRRRVLKRLFRGEDSLMYALVPSATDFPHIRGRETTKFTNLYLDDKIPISLFFFLPALYGGVHLSAWGFNFPSRTEELLWKIACLDIMGSSIVGALVISPGKLGLDGIWETIYGYFAITSLVVLAFVYALSRVYIVTEAFVSLRHVPVGVYATVPWSQNIPHI